MANLWSYFCGCSDITDKNCDSDLIFITNPSSCMNHVLIICFDFVLLVMLLINMFYKSPLKSTGRSCFQRKTCLQLVSMIFNGLLGTLCSCLGIWTLKTTISTKHTVLPLHQWILFLFHGLTWLTVSLTLSLFGKRFPKTPIRLLSISAFLFSGILAILSVVSSIDNKKVSIKIALDLTFFLGAALLLACTYKGYNYAEPDEKDLYTPLNGESKDIKVSYNDNLTPLAKAGFFHVMSFWWLNPLMKTGSEKTLEEKDMPKLCIEDRAESCYLAFVDQYNNQKQLHPSPSILRTIVMCNLRELLISGFFALMKIITVSSGPLFLKAFIRVAEGDESFNGEGYVLAIALFFSKILESLSQRQWDFRCRLIGIRVRSLLTAAIYKKQLKLSNAAKITHSAGEIINYATVDAYRIGEFPSWLHQSWTTILQLLFALLILLQAVGLATFAALGVIILSVLCNMPLAKLQHKFQSKLMVAQDERLKAVSEALVNMKVLKLYAWEIHFKGVIEKLRQIEYKWLSAVQLRRAYNSFLFWSSPLLVSTATFGACYLIGIPLNASNVFTFVATLRLVQDPIRTIPDVIGIIIQAKVAFSRILNFLEAPELESAHVRQKVSKEGLDYNIFIDSASLSWDGNLVKPTLRKINLRARFGQKIAICGEVGSGKSTLLAGILGEVPIIEGTLQVYGSIAYVTQSAWIQTGSIRDNILFGSGMDDQRYQETLKKCSLVKDLELLPYGDLTEIGERGVNLSGGQKQRIQLARALYQDADIYLLDDPFSAVDAHTASSLFNEYVMDALSRKTVLLVTHQVDFLPAFDSVLLMSDGEILAAAPYNQLMASSQEFQDLVNAHKETAGCERLAEVTSSTRQIPSIKDIKNRGISKTSETSDNSQLIRKEEREEGDAGFRPYIQYLNQNKGYVFFSIAALSHVTFVACNVFQNSWMAANVDNDDVSTLKLIVVYLAIGVVAMVFLLVRSLFTVALGLQSSKSIFSQLLTSLFRVPMSFYDSTPLGRVLSRVSVDLSIIDLDIPFNLIFAVAATTNFYTNTGMLIFVTWQVLFVSIPLIYVALRLQRYYFSSAKMLMRINGTTKSLVANHLSESVAGSMIIRAFQQEDRFFAKNLEVVDINASPYLHSFASNNWLIQRLETISATVLSASGLCMVLLPPGTFSSGFIGMAMSYGLSLNMSLVMSIQNQCTLVNYIISVERVNQYMHLPSEAPLVIEENRPPPNWPNTGKVDIQDLKIRYRPDAPLVLRGVTCTFQGGHKIGIVGRTGSGKTTLIGALFRLVEPAGGKIVVDGIDISTVGLHDLRSQFGVIPQDPTLFNGTVRYNLDPLCQHSDHEIWEVLGKCQLREAVQDKTGGLDSIVVEDGTNWSMGQRQLFCLGRALLRRSKILVLDEATASVDRKLERESKQTTTMATSSFSITNHISNSSITDFSFSNQRSKNLLLLKVKLYRKVQCSRRNLLVTKVASRNQQLQKLADQSVEEETTDTLDNGILVPDSESVISSIKYHAEFTPLFSPEKFELPKAFYATAESVRDTLITNWNTTYSYHEKMNVKQAYYLSMEFLQGRALLNAIGNLELSGAYAEALKKLGHDLEDVARQEQDAALGNGGLGRLASCFLDSLATLNYPAWGYGLRYKYGLFKQLITKDGQEEVAESWLEMGNPWEIPRKDVSYPIKFYGEVVTGPDGHKKWVGGENISAVAYDVPIPGYKTKTTINLRLWSTMVGPEYFDLKAFNSGDHAKAYEALKKAEKICYILYPGDESHEGKTLRLKQQYTLCSASLQDIISRFERRSGDALNWNDFPEKVAVQMNDTHPTLCIPELLRILMDVKGLSWKEAWGITQRTVAYTNHTVLPEALEKWSLNLLQELLPRHIEIIKMIDTELIDTIIDEYGIEDLELLKEKLNQMRVLENVELPASILELLVQPDEIPTVDSVEEEEKSEGVTEPTSEDDELKVKVAKDVVVRKKVSFDTDPKSTKMVRMANLCVVGGHAVNGVAEIHSEIVKNEVFNDFYKLWPEKFQNKTNGVTPRRWISFCNPELSKIITKWTGTEDWLLNTEKIDELRKFADNEELQSEWRKAKRINKERIVSFLKEKTGYLVSPDAMFDVQVKRIHEYKRQLLNIMGIVYRYKKMKEMNADERKAKFVPRVCIFGGKAFATYIQAKRIVKFITDVGATVNNDPDIGDLLKVVFVPDYNVTVAEVLIPGSDLSQHISTAGMEASGTSNMKFAMNGCIQIGTLDGANVEIRQEVGEENFFLFGAEAHEISGLRKERSEGKFVPDPRFEEVKKYVRSGVFGPYNYDELMGSLEGNEGYGRADYFLVGKDFPAYIECQEKVDEAYRDQKKWTKMSILNTAGSHKFSSDRTIHQYASDIWMIEPLVLPN